MLSIDLHYLMTIGAEIEVEPAHENNVLKAEIYANTTASVFVGPGNEGNLGNEYKFLTLLGKVPNLAKHLRRFDSHLIAPGLQNQYVDVVDGENSLGFFPKKLIKQQCRYHILSKNVFILKRTRKVGMIIFFNSMKHMLISENHYGLHSLLLLSFLSLRQVTLAV